MWAAVARTKGAKGHKGQRVAPGMMRISACPKRDRGGGAEVGVHSDEIDPPHLRGLADHEVARAKGVPP